MPDTLHGAVCRRFAAHVDMERASAASGEGLPPPQVDRFEELRALPVAVWIDGQHVRRIRFEQAPFRRLTLDLWEFGVPVDELDWSRLPAFRSPGYEPKPWYQRALRRYRRVANGQGTRAVSEGMPKVQRPVGASLAWQFALTGAARRCSGRPHTGRASRGRGRSPAARSARRGAQAGRPGTRRAAPARAARSGWHNRPHHRAGAAAKRGRRPGQRGCAG